MDSHGGIRWENEFSARREDADGPYRRAVEDVDAAVGHGLVHEHRREARRRAERVEEVVAAAAARVAHHKFRRAGAAGRRAEQRPECRRDVRVIQHVRADDDVEAPYIVNGRVGDVQDSRRERPRVDGRVRAPGRLQKRERHGLDVRGHDARRLEDDRRVERRQARAAAELEHRRRPFELRSDPFERGARRVGRRPDAERAVGILELLERPIARVVRVGHAVEVVDARVVADDEAHELPALPRAAFGRDGPAVDVVRRERRWSRGGRRVGRGLGDEGRSG